VPLTARDGDEDIDATAVADERWGTFYKQKPARFLICRGCERDVTAKVSKLGNRYFAHRKENSACPTAGETEEHRMLKRAIAQAITDAGGKPTIEAYPKPGDRGGWRADVIGEVNGRRTAFEVQRSPMSVQVGEFRTDRYGHDDITACWVTARDAHWMWKFPSAKIEHDPETDRWSVVRGHVVAGTDRFYWDPGPPVVLERFVRLVLNREIEALRTDCHLKETWTSGGRVREGGHSDWHGWVRRDHLAKVQLRRNEDERIRRERELAWRSDHRQIRIAAERSTIAAQNEIPLVERRHRVWPATVAWARTLCAQDETVTIGDHRADPDDVLLKRDRLTRTAMIKSGERHAYGPTVWVSGPHGHRLVAVVCPWTGSIDDSMARDWRRAKVRVYVETMAEGADVRSKVGNGTWIEITVRSVQSNYNDLLSPT